MMMEKPEVMFVAVDLDVNTTGASDECTNCAKTGGGYRGGGQGCYGDDTVSTECEDADARDLEG